MDFPAHVFWRLSAQSMWGTRVKKMASEVLTKELLEEYQRGQYMTQQQIADATGCNQQQVSLALKKHGLRTETKGRIRNLVGQKFGRLVVLEAVPKSESGRCFHWRCQCDCGKITEVRRGSLVNGSTKSCGCYKESKVGNLHQAWRGFGSIPGGFISKYKGHSKRRGIEFDLTLAFLDRLFSNQNGLCALSGLPLSFDHYGYKSQYATASLDRIDSNGNYAEQNVQWLHKEINFMKGSLTQERFLELCRIVTEHNEKPQEAYPV